MKNKLLSIIILLHTSYLLPHTCYAQQIPLQGIISIQNSAFESADGKREYVPNATIEDLYAQAQSTTSNSDGEFTLTYIGVAEKEAVEYTVKKEGLEVVNARNGIVTSTLGQYAKVKIYMCSPEKLADNRKKYFQVGKTSLEKSLEQKLQTAYKELDNLVAASNADSEKLQAQNDIINRLLKEKEEINKQAKELSEKFAEVNLDDQSENYQNAFRHFMDGEIDEALAILEEIDLEQRLQTNQKEIQKDEAIVEAKRKRIEEKKEEIRQDVEVVVLKARLHKLKYQFAEAEKQYDLAVEYDSLNMQLLSEYGIMLHGQNRHYKAIKIFEKGLRLTDNYLIRAIFLNSLALLYDDIQELEKSEAYFIEALPIFRELARKKLDTFLPTILNNLGALSYKRQELEKSKAYFMEALQIRRELAKKNPDIFLPDVATTLNGLGLLFNDIQELEKSEVHYTEALQIKKGISRKKPLMLFYLM